MDVSNVTEAADQCLDNIEESILDQTFIRVTLICLYLLVFFVCLIGNLFAIIVICLHKSMRTSTNFFLGNLAFADLLVAIFCILQNLFHIIYPYWIFGAVVCKLYVLVLHMVPCAVIGILVCVSLEKYIAVLHPLLALKLLTPKLRLVMVSAIWIISLVINLPYYFTTKQLGENLKYCARVNHGFISTSMMITISFVFWYCIPLLIMIFLYSRIGIVLWKSSLSPLEVRYSNDTVNFEIEALNRNGNQINSQRYVPSDDHNGSQPNNPQHGTTNTQYAVESRKRVIRLLIAIVSSFSILTAPYHIRLMHGAWSNSSYCNNNPINLFQPISFLLLFANTASNPILYAFLSKRFRSATKELLNCNISGGRKFTRTRTICSEVAQDACVGSSSPSLQARAALQVSRN